VDLINIQKKDVIYDIGSGLGNVCMQVRKYDALLYCFFSLYIHTV